MLLLATDNWLIRLRRLWLLLLCLMWKWLLQQTMFCVVSWSSACRRRLERYRHATVKWANTAASLWFLDANWKKVGTKQSIKWGRCRHHLILCQVNVASRKIIVNRWNLLDDFECFLQWNDDSVEYIRVNSYIYECKNNAIATIYHGAMVRNVMHAVRAKWFHSCWDDRWVFCANGLDHTT